MGNFYYYGRFKDKKDSMAKTSVAHRTIRARCSGELLRRFDEYKFYSPQRYNESEFIKTLIKEAIDKRDADSWAKEVEELYAR